MGGIYVETTHLEEPWQTWFCVLDVLSLKNGGDRALGHYELTGCAPVEEQTSR